MERSTCQDTLFAVEEALRSGGPTYVFLLRMFVLSIFANLSVIFRRNFRHSASALGQAGTRDNSHWRMLMKLRILLMLPLAILSLITVPPASAEAVHIRTPISFTLAGCTQLPAGLVVNGSGESFVVLNSRIDQNGNAVIQRNDLVTGTATDSNGATYSFNYHNHSTTTVPPSGFPFTLETTDHFTLIGAGKANDVKAHFVASATILSLSPFVATVAFKTIHGNPFACDPI